MFWRKKQLTPQEEDELIEKVANKIVDADLGPVSLMFIETYKPLAIFWGGLARFYSAAWLPLFGNLGDLGADIIDVFDRVGNVDKLIKRINDLIKEKKKIKESKK